MPFLPFVYGYPSSSPRAYCTKAFLLCATRAGSVVLLNVLGCWLTYLGQAETSAEAWFNIALCLRKPEGTFGRKAQDSHLDSHTAPELCCATRDHFALRSQKRGCLLGTGTGGRGGGTKE